jgi:hypothetical protein
MSVFFHFLWMKDIDLGWQLWQLVILVASLARVASLGAIPSVRKQSRIFFAFEHD